VQVPLVPSRREWSRVLEELVHQLDDGRLYDRDLQPLAVAVNAVLAAFERRWDIAGPRYRDRRW
jgi:hypothetical protein